MRFGKLHRAGLGAAVILASACGPKDTPPAQPSEIATIPTSSQVTFLWISRAQPLGVTLSKDHNFRVLSLPDGVVRRTIDVGDRPLDVIAISPDGRTIAVGDHKGRISAWDSGTGDTRLDLQLARYPGLAVFSHDGSTLAIAAQGDPVQLIDMATGRAATTLGGPIGGTSALAFSPDDRLVATGDGDAGVRVYDARTGQRIAENHEFLMVPLTVVFTSDGTTVISGGGDKVLHFIDASTGKTARKMERSAQPPAFVDVSPDGSAFTTVFMKAEDMTSPEHVVVRAITSGQQLADWLPPTMPVGGGWTRDGHMLVATATPDAIHLWRLR